MPTSFRIRRRRDPLVAATLDAVEDHALGRKDDGIPPYRGVRPPGRRVSHRLTRSPFVLQTAAAGYTGNGHYVAVLDSGVDYQHADFGSCTAPGVPATCRVAGAYEMAANDGSLDDDGRGSNVSGIALGVAPGARILNYDVFNPTTDSAANIDIKKARSADHPPGHSGSRVPAWASSSHTGNRSSQGADRVKVPVGRAVLAAACPASRLSWTDRCKATDRRRTSSTKVEGTKTFVVAGVQVRARRAANHIFAVGVPSHHLR